MIAKLIVTCALLVVVDLLPVPEANPKPTFLYGLGGGISLGYSAGPIWSAPIFPSASLHYRSSYVSRPSAVVTAYREFPVVYSAGPAIETTYVENSVPVAYNAHVSAALGTGVSTGVTKGVAVVSGVGASNTKSATKLEYSSSSSSSSI